MTPGAPSSPPAASGAPPAGARRGGSWAGAGFWAGFHLARNLKRRGTLVGVIAIPVLVALMRFAFGVPRDAVGQLVLIYLVPLISLWFGGGVLREEVEDQTLTYGFTRPVARTALYTARLAAAVGPVLLATVPAAVVAASGPLDAVRLGGAAILGTTAHCALFGLVGLLVRRPTWLGLAYVFVWEQTIQQVPGWLSSFTLRMHIRTIADLDLPSLFPGLTADAMPWWGSAVVLVGVSLLGVVLAGVRISRRALVVTR